MRPLFSTVRAPPPRLARARRVVVLLATFTAIVACGAVALSLLHSRAAKSLGSSQSSSSSSLRATTALLLADADYAALGASASASSAFAADRRLWVGAPNPPRGPIRRFERQPAAGEEREEKGEADNPEIVPSVLVLTPVKNSAGHLGRYFRMLRNITWPKAKLSLGMLDSDSDDGPPSSPEVLERLRSMGYGEGEQEEEDIGRMSGTMGRILSEVPRLLDDGWAAVTVVQHDFHFTLPRDVRHTRDAQRGRRAVLARARNHLLISAMREEDWVLWIDSDLAWYAPDTLAKLIAAAEKGVPVAAAGGGGTPKSAGGMAAGSGTGAGAAARPPVVPYRYGKGASHPSGGVLTPKRKSKTPPEEVEGGAGKRGDAMDGAEAAAASAPSTTTANARPSRVPLDILVPNCVMQAGTNARSYDLNSWRGPNAPGNNATVQQVIAYHDRLEAKAYAAGLPAATSSHGSGGGSAKATSQPSNSTKPRAPSLPAIHSQLWLEGYGPTGAQYMHKLRHEGNVVRLDAVGGAMLLVRGELHRHGLIFPAAVYRHRIETEGLSMMAMDMGSLSWGMPNLEIVHH